MKNNLTNVEIPTEIKNKRFIYLFVVFLERKLRQLDNNSFQQEANHIIINNIKKPRFSFGILLHRY